MKSPIVCKITYCLSSINLIHELDGDADFVRFCFAAKLNSQLRLNMLYSQRVLRYPKYRTKLCFANF